MSLTREQIEGFRIVLLNWTGRDSSRTQDRWMRLCDLAILGLEAQQSLPSTRAYTCKNTCERAMEIIKRHIEAQEQNNAAGQISRKEQVDGKAATNHPSAPAAPDAAHPESDICGFDRETSLSEDCYVCQCGFVDRTTPNPAAPQELRTTTANPVSDSPTPAAAALAVSEEAIQWATVLTRYDEGMPLSWGEIRILGAEILRLHAALPAVVSQAKAWRDFISIQSGDVQAMVRDAERYRWLRDEDRNPVDSFWVARGQIGRLSRWFGHPLDAAIDSAMRGAK